MTQIDFSPVFNYIDKKLEELKEVFVTKEEFSRLQISVDSLVKRFDEHNAEIATLGHRSDRMEGWIGKAAPKVGIPYET